MSGEHSIKTLCAVLTVSRSGYYSWQSAGESPRARETRALGEQIARVHAASLQTYGSPRVSAALRAEGTPAGRGRVARLMREAGLQGRQRRRYRVRTTDSNHDQPVAPNRLAQAPAPPGPTKSGRPISPMWIPMKAGCTWPGCSTYAAAG